MHIRLFDGKLIWICTACMSTKYVNQLEQKNYFNNKVIFDTQKGSRLIERTQNVQYIWAKSQTPFW